MNQAADPAIVLALAELTAEVRGLRSDLDQMGRKLSLTLQGKAKPADIEQAETAADALLPAIADAVGERRFTTRELLAHADLCPGLMAAVAAAVGGRDARRLGKLLARHRGKTVAGCRVVQDGAEHGVLLWQVSRVV